MPKKTTYSRNTAQRTKPKQKSFELVRPISDENVLETVEDSGELEATDVETLEPEVAEAPEEKASSKRVSSTAATATATVAGSAPKSASARIAARRQARQPKTQQRSAANMVLAENYSYVRKDLLFILILAIIMLAIIVVLHFVIGS